jgi:anti-sigma regulatory factor (Ser/Thr protein kinase)
MAEEVAGPPPLAIDVRQASSVGEARRAARTIAATLGFPPAVAEEIALAVTELASNLIRHAGGGTLALTPLSPDGRVGLEVESVDQGPGIADVEQALGDRYSTAGSRGTGLGAVNRLMDELDIASRPGSGTRVVCRRWRRDYPVSTHACPLDAGVATRARQLDPANGDAFVVKHWAETLLVGVIDGLGHGPVAKSAARAAQAYAESHFDLPLDQIFRGAGRACRATRGVVMALARFDWGRGRLAFASVGNIEVRVFPLSRAFNFSVRRGVVGLNAPSAVVTEHPWPPGHALVLHSDGLASHWSWSDFPGLTDRPAPAIAQELLRRLAKEDDDATVIVVKEAAP